MQKHPRNPDGEIGWQNVAVRPSLKARLDARKERIERETGTKLSMNDILKPMVDAWEAMEAQQVTA